jgi:hypothetical protein
MIQLDSAAAFGFQCRTLHATIQNCLLLAAYVPGFLAHGALDFIDEECYFLMVLELMKQVH